MFTKVITQLSFNLKLTLHECKSHFIFICVSICNIKGTSLETIKSQKKKMCRLIYSVDLFIRTNVYREYRKYSKIQSNNFFH